MDAITEMLLSVTAKPLAAEMIYRTIRAGLHSASSQGF